MCEQHVRFGVQKVNWAANSILILYSLDSVELSLCVDDGAIHRSACVDFIVTQILYCLIIGGGCFCLYASRGNKYLYMEKEIDEIVTNICINILYYI